MLTEILNLSFSKIVPRQSWPEELANRQGRSRPNHPQRRRRSETRNLRTEIGKFDFETQNLETRFFNLEIGTDRTCRSRGDPQSKRSRIRSFFRFETRNFENWNIKNRNFETRKRRIGNRWRHRRGRRRWRREKSEKRKKKIGRSQECWLGWGELTVFKTFKNV